MKTFLIVLCFAAVAVMADNELTRKRRFLLSGISSVVGSILQRCSHESECGPNKCCLMGKYCSPKLLFKYATCYTAGITNCGCRDGLECRVTKEFTILGQTIKLKQCMESGRSLEVERLEDEDMQAMSKESRQKRFLIDRCSKESDCGDNRCCLFGKFCAKKLSEGMTCYLGNVHKCGCQDGLVCKITTQITIPIIGHKIPIRQCVRD
ncbi:uncharacterized protein LOC110242503 [Exaiptasia diaphana]|uniref:Uncharacterized protein n=1 Tax=Exaiptasia diaphana TaxID=2652724 RepID=A0A913XGR2_EXADI|nr:uncharacterized protein LOC110242503 [Exaiptasia diaphana]KXJ12230.1 hypothetical protein AC249_AIPGENE5651 [Exaiptasia diaphana]